MLSYGREQSFTGTSLLCNNDGCCETPVGRSRYAIPQNAIQTRVDDYCLLTEFMKGKYKYFRTECTITCHHRELVVMNNILFPFHQKACHLHLHFMASINKLDNGAHRHIQILLAKTPKWLSASGSQ